MSIKKLESRTYLRDGRAPIPEKESTSRTMSRIKAKNTKPELLLRKAMWKEGIKGYRLHWKKAPGKPDIAFPGRKIAIFVHGCFWHRCPHCGPSLPKTHKDFWKDKFKKNKERDKKKINDLQEDGWKVIIIWECKIKKNIEDCLNKIREVLEIDESN